MRTTSILCALSLLLFTAQAQEQKIIDSLNKILADTSLTELKHANALAHLGWQTSFSDETLGLHYSEKALEIGKMYNDSHLIAYANFVSGAIYLDLSSYPLALERLEMSKKYFDAFQDTHGISLIHGYFGALYQKRKEYRKALNAFNAQQKYFKSENERARYVSWFNIGDTYRLMGMEDSALHFYNKILANSKIDSTDIFVLYINIANAYSDAKDYASAKQFLIKSPQFLKDTSLHYYYADYFRLYGEIELGLKKYDLASQYTLKALNYFIKIGIKDNIYKSCLTLSEIYEQQGNLPLSLTYYKRYSALRDSVNSEENERQVKFVEAKFGLEKKDKENDILKKDQKIKQEELNHKSTILYAFVAGGILLFLALTVAVYGFVNKRKVNKKLMQLNHEVLGQKHELFEKNRAITDSLVYAQRIQQALLTSKDYIKRIMPEGFILNMPKDIVSGDFYWAFLRNNKFFFMCADCTGHGVPGAFMSLLGINFLNEIVVEKGKDDPSQILNELRTVIIQSLNREGSSETKDGMDCALVSIDINTLEISVAAANNPVWIIRPPEKPFEKDESGNLKLAPGFKFTECKPDKMPVGISPRDTNPFQQRSHQLKKGDCVYMFSDGFADQFGGPKGKKFKYKQLKEFIFLNCHRPMEEQKEELLKVYSSWKGKLEQIDDVLVAGFKV